MAIQKTTESFYIGTFDSQAPLNTSEGSTSAPSDKKRKREEEQKKTSAAVQNRLPVVALKRARAENPRSFMVKTLLKNLSSIVASVSGSYTWEQRFENKFGSDLHELYSKGETRSEKEWEELCATQHFITLGEFVVPVKDEEAKSALAHGSFYFSNCFTSFKEQFQPVKDITLPDNFSHLQECAAKILELKLNGLPLPITSLEEAIDFSKICEFFGFLELADQAKKYCLENMGWNNCEAILSVFTEPKPEEVTQVFNFFWSKIGEVACIFKVSESLKTQNYLAVESFLRTWALLNQTQEISFERWHEEDTISYFLGFCPNLECLKVNQRLFPYSPLSELQHLCPNLKTLDLRCHKMQINFLNRVLCHPELNEFHWRAERFQWHDEYIEKSPTTIEKTESLIQEHCPNLKKMTSPDPDNT